VSSRWREFAYMFHELQRAVIPETPLPDVMENWAQIAGELAERSRRRNTQVAAFFPVTQSS